MPTYALLGATGATGSAILRALINNPPSNLTLNILVRSRTKLDTAFPTLSSALFPIHIFQGSATDTITIHQCIASADTIFACIATNSASRDISIAQDTANSIIASLRNIDSPPSEPATRGRKPPTILLLRSASLNPILRAKMPFAASIAEFCFYYIYTDLKVACELYESAAAETPPLLNYVYIDPPSIHDAEGTTATGYKIMGMDENEDVGEMGDVISYADLGEGFCEVAGKKEEVRNVALGIWGTGKVNATVGTLMGFAARGVKSRVWG